MEVSIYVKSRFRGNPRGPGKAAAVIEYIDKSGKSHTRSRQIGIERDTRNALHLKVSIAAMRILVKPCDITIYIDNDYLSNACKQGWPEKWQQDGWKRANGKVPANLEDWKQFYMLTQIHKVSFADYADRYDKELESALSDEDKITA